VAEQAEIERILDELSVVVAGQAGSLRETLEALARFDFWSAKARLAEEMDAIPAEIAIDLRSCSWVRAIRACPEVSSRSISGSAATTQLC